MDKKLENGQVFKNYKELCAFMGWKIYNGDGKIRQFKELTSLCNYHKQGHKIIIDNVFETQKEIPDGRVDAFFSKEDMKRLLTHYLSVSNEFTLSKNALYTLLGLVNCHFKDIKYDEDYKDRVRYCCDHVISEETIEDFIKTHTDKIKYNLDKVLNEMQTDKILEWRCGYTLGYEKTIEGEETIIKYRNATMEEEQFIQKIEEQILEEKLVTKGETDINKKTLYNKGLYMVWARECVKQIKLKFSADFYFKNYKIKISENFKPFYLTEEQIVAIEDNFIISMGKSTKKSALVKVRI